jgi:hypothetical protein
VGRNPRKFLKPHSFTKPPPHDTRKQLFAQGEGVEPGFSKFSFSPRSAYFEALRKGKNASVCGLGNI